jgi:hypothetical protein
MTTMKTEIAIEIANALTPILSPFHLIDVSKLLAVSHVYSEGSLDTLLLDFGEIRMLVKADENDDTIDFIVAQTVDLGGVEAVDVSHQEPWSKVIGKSFGWGWALVNQQGYCDGILLSFEGVSPRIILNVMASSIKTGLIEWIKN